MTTPARSWRRAFQEGFLAAWNGAIDDVRMFDWAQPGYKDGVQTFRREGHRQKSEKKPGK